MDMLFTPLIRWESYLNSIPFGVLETHPIPMSSIQVKAPTPIRWQPSILVLLMPFL